MPTWVLFGDDSGNREYDDQRNYIDSGRSRYFVYGALLMEEQEAQFLIQRLRELKVLTFKTADVEVKSNWLRMPDERKKRYLDRFGVSDADLSSFVDDYYVLIRQAPLRFLGAVVDKLHMQETYKSPWMAPTAAYEVLMQRAALTVPSGDELIVTMDDISGRTAAKNEYKQLLDAHHAKLRKVGSTLQTGISFACLKRPVRFTNSATSDLVQVADVAAYNLHRQFRDFGVQWEQNIDHLPLYEHFARIAGKFLQGPENRIQGYGVVKFPLKNRVRWVLRTRKENVAAP